MKKYFLLSALIFAIGAVLPQAAKAQWTNPYSTYKTNGLIINSPKKKTVTKKGTAKRVGTKKKAVRRTPVKKRKVAAAENVIFPKFYYIASPERNYTV